MKYTIKKGKHRAWPVKLGIFFRKKNFNRKVVFSESCRYEIGSDQDDTNKLFGIGYFPNHHKESARFGWAYVPETGKIAIVAYCYVNGERITRRVCKVDIGIAYLFNLVILKNEYVFQVQGETVRIPYFHKKGWGFPLNVYFGGNIPAPHEMTIQVSKF